MNFSEFRRLLFSDPASPDAEYQAARRSDPEFVQAAAESDAFEQRLLRATRLPAPAGWSEQLNALVKDSQGQRAGSFYRFRYALAATVILALSAVVLTQQLRLPESVEDYVAHHFDVDGYKVLDMANQPNTSELASILADFDLQMSPELSSKVRFVKLCDTPEGLGIHLVLGTEQGLVTVIFMPGSQVQEGERFAFHDMQAALVNLPGLDVSAAIISRAEQMQAAQNLALGEALQKGVFRPTTGA
jgi:hypothetical protein